MYLFLIVYITYSVKEILIFHEITEIRNSEFLRNCYIIHEKIENKNKKEKSFLFEQK